jgi:hypothetical protein
MERSTLEWFDLLGKALLWAAGIVLVLSLIGAVAVATSDSTIPFAEDVERQGRGIFAIVSIGGGIAAAGVLSGLGAIVSMMVADRKAALAEPEAGSPPEAPPAGGSLP